MCICMFTHIQNVMAIPNMFTQSNIYRNLGYFHFIMNILSLEILSFGIYIYFFSVCYMYRSRIASSQSRQM